MRWNSGKCLLITFLYSSLSEKSAVINCSLPNDAIYMAPGLKKHVKKKHKDCLKYLEFISDIITNPDYVGINPNEPDSLEFVKIFEDNILY